MSDAKHTPGPWKFEPHNGYGGEIDGDPFPFGYISTSAPQPIFELSVILEFDAEELRANSRLIAAAPEMLAALREALRCLAGLRPLPATEDVALCETIEIVGRKNDRVREIVRAAIAKAEGRVDG